MNIETTYYDPCIGAGIAGLFQPNTRAVVLESPSSGTLEIQDVPTIAAIAHDRDICVLMDNSWAPPLFLKPLELGGGRHVHDGSP